MPAAHETDGHRDGADGWTVLAVPGELDFYSAGDFDKLLAPITAEPGRRVVLDMREVVFMDSTGLRVLLGAARDLRDSGGLLRLAGPREHVLRLLELTQVGSLLPTYDDIGSACHD